MKIVIFIFVLFTSEVQKALGIVGYPLHHAYPCNNETDIIIEFESGRPPGEENQYNVNIGIKIPKNSQINMTFDTEAVVTLNDPTKARMTVSNENFNIRFFDSANSVGFSVKGPASGAIPYFESLNVNNVDYCKDPNKGYLDQYITGQIGTAETHLKTPDDSCGRRKIEHKELIVNGHATKPGDWPWHVAIYKVTRATIKYKCGGTLISENFVLTAAHCTTVRGEPVLPEILNVVLGKYNLVGGDIETQEREVHTIIVHEDFNHLQFDNDISLLKLKTRVKYGDHVQPACLWYPTAVEKLPNKDIKGTVVEWGFDENDTSSNQLRQITMPQVSESTCIKSNPQFYSWALNNKKFCAGWGNETSACNSDSGSGFHVFIPDETGNAAPNATGAWYVYGIVSLSLLRRDVALCDPSQYVVFTKIAEYRSWIQKHVN